MAGEREAKLVQIFPKVYASLGGDRKRGLKMMDHVVASLNRFKVEREMEPDSHFVC